MVEKWKDSKCVVNVPKIQYRLMSCELFEDFLLDKSHRS